MIRATTNGVLKSYKSNLMHSFITMNKARDKVLTQRNFNTYAEDPAGAAQAFQLRRSFQRVSSQYTVSQSTVRQYESAWGALGSVVNAVDNDPSISSLKDILMADNDPTGAGRKPLGEKLLQFAESITQTMNGKYGDSFLFAGADGLKVPFEWQTNADGVRQLCYRGIPVDAAEPDVMLDATGAPLVAAVGTDNFVIKSGNIISQNDYTNAPAPKPDIFKDAQGNFIKDKDGNYILTADAETMPKAEYDQAVSDYAALEYMANETRYVDIGLGLQEDANGNLIKSSAFNSSLPGINFLGYGSDEDGDPKNIASIIHRMGTILSNCTDDGYWGSDADKEEFFRLGKKFEQASADLKEKHVEMDAEASFLKSNELQLEVTADTLNTQFLGIEQCDPADAITAFSWAQYCYNAALKVGNSILSQSLMDYMQ